MPAPSLEQTLELANGSNHYRAGQPTPPGRRSWGNSMESPTVFGSPGQAASAIASSPASRRSASASIWRTRSRVMPSCLPTRVGPVSDEPEAEGDHVALPIRQRCDGAANSVAADRGVDLVLGGRAVGRRTGRRSSCRRAPAPSGRATGRCCWCCSVWWRCSTRSPSSKWARAEHGRALSTATWHDPGCCCSRW